MSKEQIEKMDAKSLKELVDLLVDFGRTYDDSVQGIEDLLCEAIINAGYRKQKKGEWIDKPTGAYSRMQSWCSACGKHSGIGGIESNRHKPFCPNCGAHMKGADNG